MRKYRHWFDGVKAQGAWLSLLFALGFNVHWAYEFDRCVQKETLGGGQFSCLMSSLFSVYWDWSLWTWRLMAEAAGRFL
jgi:hypothetical protein